MNNSEEPPQKKAKLHEDMILNINKYIEKIKNNDKPLKVVLNNDVSKPLPLVKVYTGLIKDVKAISKTILLLNEILPLNELQHLKRVRKRDIVICPSQNIKDTTIKNFLIELDEKLLNIFESFKEENVPQLPPKLKSQYEESKKYWPCNFHPDKYLESLFNGDVFSKTEHSMHISYMQVVFNAAKWFYENNYIDDDTFDNSFKDFNVSVVVDPSINSVVAISTDNRRNHPTQHSTMLAIDNVARTQHGGAWDTVNELDSETFIDKELLAVLKKEHPDVKFGHRQFVSKRQSSNDVVVSNEDSPYLCTGYYVYMLKEPCVMCSMALVHARAKRIFFCFDNKEDGGLKSKAKLQTIASLNHHFEVFTGFL